MIEVIPAILENNFAEIEKKISILEDLNLIDSKEKFISSVQIDLADGTLVPNTTFLDPTPFATLKTQLNLELHLMVSDPLRYLERFAKVGFKRFYAHVEGSFVEDYIAQSYQLGVEVGLAIDGPTPVDPSAACLPARQGEAGKIHKYLDNIDCILVMAIEAGASGRPFRPDTIEKIKKIREADLEIPIAVDGAMNEENAAKVVSAGATRICANSYIFTSSDIKEAIMRLTRKGRS